MACIIVSWLADVIHKPFRYSLIPLFVRGPVGVGIVLGRLLGWQVIFITLYSVRIALLVNSVTLFLRN